jgi:hypothetical protein
MAISRVPGFSLLSDLDRQGVDLQFTTESNALVYMDFTNFRLGINDTAPSETLTVNGGNVLVSNGHLYTGANLSYDIGSTTNYWRTVYATELYGTLLTNAQPNITSVGTLTALSIAGNLTVGGVAFANVSTTGDLNAGNNQVIYVASPINSTDAANKAYVDGQILSANKGNTIPLGTPTDGDLTGVNAAYQGFTTDTTVTDAIDILNSVTQNLFTDTFVRSVSFSSNVTAGGVGQTILLTMVPQGNVNQYVIQWGDGTANTTTTSSSVTHTYTTNVDTPYTVVVQASNTNGASPSNVAGAVRTNYITIYAADPSVDFSLFRANVSASPLSGNDLYSIQGNVIYLQNTSTNTNTANVVTWSINWGDGTYANVPNNSSSGGTTGPFADKTYVTNTGTGTLSVNLALLTSDITNPAILPRYKSTSLKVYDNDPSPPAGFDTKVLTFTSSVGTSPLLSSNATDNTPGTTLSPGDTVNRTTAVGSSLIRAESGNVSTSFTYSANIGYLQAVVNGLVQGNVNIAETTSSTINGNLGVISFSDYWLLTSAGATTTFAASTYYPGYYWGVKANVIARGDAIPVGVNRFGLNHSSTGSTGNVEFVKDNLTTTPTISNTGSLLELSGGTKRYISGIPYYNTGSPTLRFTGVEVSDLIGQTYRNTTTPLQVTSGTNAEGTTSAAISTQSYTYSGIDGAVTFLNGGIPVAGTGVATAYAIGNLTVNLTSSSVRTVETLGLLAYNVNGTGATAQNATKVQVHTAAQSGISEVAIAVSADLGSGFDDNGVRIFDFSADTTDNPTYNSATNYYTNSIYTESSDLGVEGTQEATVRIGVLKHDTTDYSSGYLPVGPDRSGDTGTQYFTFAFRRTIMANFRLNITSSAGISGVWIAAPGTTIDNTSTLNGWLDATTTYAGAGVPGANTAAGGNGSNGCAFTSGDRIQTGVSLSGGYTMTLGSENSTNATGNVVLVRIALATGQSISAISVGVAV